MQRASRRAGWSAGSLIVTAILLVVSAIVALAAPAQAATVNPLAHENLFVVPNNPALVASRSNPSAAGALAKIANESTAMWITERTNLNLLDVYQDAAVAKRQVPTYVLYAIPRRDCGSWSSGGFTSAGAYQNWVNTIRTDLAGREAIFIIEPDALPKLTICGLTKAGQDQRLALIRYAAQRLATPKVHVYLEGGGRYSNPVATIAARLNAAGIGYTSGFALNVSAFDATGPEITYGTQLSAKVGGKHFVIDTSRNGRGVPSGTKAGAFCNVSGLGLGTRPTTATGRALLDAYLWIKYPGESDGNCTSNAPYSGVFWTSYAVGLAQRAAF